MNHFLWVFAPLWVAGLGCASTPAPQKPAKKPAVRSTPVTGSILYGRRGFTRTATQTPGNVLSVDKEDIRNAGNSPGQALRRLTPVISR